MVKVGQSLWGINSYHRGPSEIKEYKVSKVGRKYFQLEGVHRMKFNVDTLKEETDFRGSLVLYLDKQNYEDQKEYDHLKEFIRKNYFDVWSGNKLSLDQLKQIMLILNPQ